MWLANRVAVVTGGASGIGAAIAERLASEGGTVAVVDQDGRRASEERLRSRSSLRKPSGCS